MKELDSFTVERLEKISNSAFYYAGAEMEEIQALARIALAAKRAEPVDEIAFDMDRGIMALVNETNIGGACQLQAKIQCFIEENLTTHPQFNSPQGWIKCSDQMPEDDEFVRIWPLPDFGVELHVGQYIKFHKNGPGWFAQVYEHNYGVEFYPITVTHWMPLLAAPEKENG